MHTKKSTVFVWHISCKKLIFGVKNLHNSKKSSTFVVEIDVLCTESSLYARLSPRQ